MTRHLLQVGEQQLQAADATLAPKISRESLEHALAQVPDSFFNALASDGAARQRAAYVAFLKKRLQAPRPFVAVLV